MAFYIAQRNKDTGKFVLWMDAEGPNEYHNESEAIRDFEMVLRMEGHNNVKLLESVSLDVDITVKRAE